MSTPTTALAPLRVVDPATNQPVALDWLPNPTNPTAALTRFTTVAVQFPSDVSDDDAETAAGLFGYAWVKHGASTHTGAIEANPVLWHDQRTMVVTANMRSRPEKSRTRVQATQDLFRDFFTFLVDGTPVRRNGTRAVPALGIKRAWVNVFVST